MSEVQPVKVRTYSNTSAPEHMRAVAFLETSPGTIHPVHHFAPSEDEARTRLQEWWDAELDRERQKTINLAARTEKLRGPRKKAA